MATLKPLPSSTAPNPPPPDLQLQLIVDQDDDLDGSQGAGSRRPSTASLSRFRSCPQLATVMNTSQDSPGSDMAPITDTDGNILHTAPALRNSLYVDLPRPEPGGVRSAAGTPTPPSTPGSRRRDPMTASVNSNGASPASTPKQSRRFRMEQAFGNRTCSADDSQGEPFDGGFTFGGLPLKEENVQRLDELYARERNMPYDDYPDHSFDDEHVSDTDEGSSMHVSGRYAHTSRHHRYYHPATGDDSVDKCSRWLQSLKLNKADKIKSRSHIQLPPI